VLAVGVIPALADAVAVLYDPRPPLAYWLDALLLTSRSACTSFVVLYLIRRSGLPPARFGLSRPRLGDLPLGLCLAVVGMALWFSPSLPVDAPEAHRRLFAGPASAVDYVLMVVKFGANGFAEELVTRAYLVTRLGRLLRSRAWAVAVAAALFASYHVYTGTRGVVYSLLLGIIFGVFFLATRRVWPLVLAHTLIDIIADLPPAP
jgi:membrane protease YdiL (CAAX protease family)